MPARIDEIRTLPLFARTSDESFRALTRGVYVQNFPTHAELIIEGEPSDFLHLIVSGRVEMFSAWGGHETSMSILEANETFILAATIKDRPYLMSARTIEKSRIILIPSEDVRAVFEADAGFAKSIVDELAGCYRGAIKTAKNIKLRNATQRIANYLLHAHQSLDGAEHFPLALEKKRIAALLGMTPENLSRGFSALGSYGVRIEGQQVHVSDAEKLRKFAKPTPLIDS